MANNIAASIRDKFLKITITTRDVINTLATYRKNEISILIPT